MRFSFLILSCLLASHHVSAQRLQRITFSPSNESIINPERGIYHVRVTGMEQGKITPYDRLALDDLVRMRSSSSLVFRYFGLKEWRTVDLPDSILRNIDRDFAAIRRAGLKAIIRFAYAANIGEPDAPLHVIMRHLDQLKLTLRKNKDVIAVLQAGFIGAWGEWHSSSNGNDTPENMRIILTRVLETLPNDRMVQVRSPKNKQKIFSLANDASGAIVPSSAFDGSPISRVGHHNDCFLADASDMGTYMRGGTLDTAFAKEYLRLDNRFVPMGGETCQPSDRSLCPQAIGEMERLRWSFLNGDYDEPTLAGFVKGGCLNVIREKLGYRFRLLGAEFTSTTAPYGKFEFRLRLINDGWASPYNPREMQLVLRNARTGDIYSATLPVDPRRWLPGDTATIAAAVGVPASLPGGAYSLLLNFPDPEPTLRARPEYSIRLANAETWEATTGYNTVRDSIRVVGTRIGEKYRGPLWFTLQRKGSL